MTKNDYGNLQVCQNCRFWWPNKMDCDLKKMDHPEGFKGRVEMDSASCHRYPPQRSIPDWNFPITQAGQWCGEWKTR